MALAVLATAALVATAAYASGEAERAGPWRAGTVDLNGDGRADVLYHSVGTRRRISDQPDGTRRYRYSSNGLRYQIFLSKGDGTFTAHPPMAALSTGHFCATWDERPGLGTHCALVDIDGDRDSDLVILLRARTGAARYDRVRVLYSTGSGTLELGPVRELDQPILVGDGWRWHWADMTGDGVADILNYSGGGRGQVGEDREGNPRYWYENAGLSYRVLASNGDGTFTAQPEATALSEGHYCRPGGRRPGIGSACSPADMNGDGRADLAILYEAHLGTSQKSRLQVLRSTDRGFVAGPQRALPAAIRDTGGWQWQWADLNRDGRADIVNYYGGVRSPLGEDRNGNQRFVDSTDGFRLQVFLSQNDGSFQHVPPSHLIETGNHCIAELGWSCELADINGDGVGDLLRVNALGGIRTQVLFGAPRGAFFVGPLNELQRGAQAPLRRQSTQPADVNGDGRTDVVIFDGWTESERSMPPWTATGRLPFRVLLSNGDGTFALVDAPFARLSGN